MMNNNLHYTYINSMQAYHMAGTLNWSDTILVDHCVPVIIVIYSAMLI